MVVRMRHTKSAQNQRRAHHALGAVSTTRCSHCSALVPPHTLCRNCGYYQGRQVIDVLAKLDKKERKKKEKELHAHETADAQSGQNLNAEELSHK